MTDTVAAEPITETVEAPEQPRRPKVKEPRVWTDADLDDLNERWYTTCKLSDEEWEARQRLTALREYRERHKPAPAAPPAPAPAATRETPPLLHYSVTDAPPPASAKPQPSEAEIRRQQERRHLVAVAVAETKRERGEPLDLVDRRALWIERVQDILDDIEPKVKAGHLYEPLGKVLVEVAEVALAFSAAHENLKARTAALEEQNAALAAGIAQMEAQARSEPMTGKPRIRVQAPSQRHQQHQHSTAPASMPNHADGRAEHPGEHAIGAPRTTDHGSNQ
ncbi:hypothetical protein [Thalassobaculum litoreum]|uniref:Uncharacterized protein n=1 Tax=Thalassobaculum litoreum DSM 18839 TaxID=1123362 RepID=A0A8G2BGG9_9PROT|nr:hypothetical protein [Thalassobaculum litoreum]SDF15571.1 hypothetical protein SAMN05660686_00491 [Thalassobaculum litoreum DSM 18839]